MNKLNQVELKALRRHWLKQVTFQSQSLALGLSKQKQSQLLDYCDDLPAHGHLNHWLDLMEALHQQTAAMKPDGLHRSVHQGAVTLDWAQPPQAFSAAFLEARDQLLKALMPWRKGPFQLFQQFIDAEWRSNLKYDRLATYGPQLKGKHLIDIGCGNGYYAYRMVEDGAASVLGVDPSQLCWAQSLCIKRWDSLAPVDILPMPGEPLFDMGLEFDLVVSMGVLYHRKSPIEHLKGLKRLMTQGGEVLLETLVINAPGREILNPLQSYAGMSNIFMIPSLGVLLDWLKQAGFKQSECVSLAYTKDQEQRQTPWVETYSLEDFLSKDRKTTQEGYPLPWRAMIRAY